MNLFTKSTVAMLGITMLMVSVPGSALAETSAPAPAAPPAAPAPTVVTVQPGEYLEKIAKANNSTALRMYYANTAISKPDLIYPNQQLRVPTAEEALAPREVPVEAPPAPPAPVQQPVRQAAPAAPAPRSSYVPTSSPAVASGSVWDRLAMCESGGNWSINTGNGYYGGLQFSLSSWRAVGGTGYPNQASREEQIARGQMLQSKQGWGAWPACTAKLGIR